MATVGIFNDLAAQAARSAAAHNIFELVVFCLDDSAREVITAVAVAPTVSANTTLPLMLRMAAEGAGFAIAEVLRTCARRCQQDSALELARALLATPAVLVALSDQHRTWLLGLLYTFGSEIWPQAMSHIEQVLDASAARELLESAELDTAEQAAFFARYFFLFSSDERDLISPLETLVAHPDWRVRAALAEGIRDEHSPHTTTSQIVMDRLARDGDYKVRAAAALALRRTTPEQAAHLLSRLLLDENWHVRERVLTGLLTHQAGSPTAAKLTAAAISILTTDESWQSCPAHLGPQVQRLLLIHGPLPPGSTSNGGAPRGRGHALFALLREARTGWTQLPDAALRALVAEGRRSPDWLVRHEADALADQHRRAGAPGPSAGTPLRREAYRRLRDRRSIQVALDMHDLNGALGVAEAAAEAGVDFLEVGDPLIKEFGVRVVERVKEHVPHITVVAEMMSSDWGRDQVVLAAEAGADVVFLIGPATVASVSAAVEAGRRLGVPILLDAPAPHVSSQWIADMERVGVDGFAVTTNIDLGVGGRDPLGSATTIRALTRLPVAVSGGFSTTDHPTITSPEWDILIVGRSVADAVNPTVAARRLADLVHNSSEGTR
jgi:3-keto-L-gulonate-6-phosphate decarboxylase